MRRARPSARDDDCSDFVQKHRPVIVCAALTTAVPLLCDTCRLDAVKRTPGFLPDNVCPLPVEHAGADREMTCCRCIVASTARMRRQCARLFRVRSRAPSCHESCGLSRFPATPEDSERARRLYLADSVWKTPVSVSAQEQPKASERDGCGDGRGWAWPVVRAGRLGKQDAITGASAMQLLSTAGQVVLTQRTSFRLF